MISLAQLLEFVDDVTTLPVKIEAAVVVACDALVKTEGSRPAGITDRDPALDIYPWTMVRLT